MVSVFIWPRGRPFRPKLTGPDYHGRITSAERQDICPVDAVESPAGSSDSPPHLRVENAGILN